MLIIYDSFFLGNVEKFVKKLECENYLKIKDNMIIQEPFILLTYTSGKGDVPNSVLKFLARGNFINMVGVASSGNRNWGENLFALSGNKISKKYNVPLIHKFENDGTKEDVEVVKNWVKNYERGVLR